MNSCAPAVIFNYSLFITRYPEFQGVPAVTAGMYFSEATLYQANHLNPVRSIDALTMLLYMVTAHIAQINSPVTTAGQNSGTPPGRLSNATEGSVSATFENLYPPGSVQWWQTTKYGAAWWAATLPYRLSYYKPGFTFGPASRAQVPWLYPNGS